MENIYIYPCNKGASVAVHSTQSDYEEMTPINAMRKRELSPGHVTIMVSPLSTDLGDPC